jgi:pimeloyl-ACP methyl ester carboxylesterase
MNLTGSSQIPFIDHGGSGTTILFSHANGYPPACYNQFLSVISRNFHVISMLSRPLWPGSNPGEIKDWHPLSTDIQTFMDQRSVQCPIAIGHSLGGIISFRAALKDPQGFKALILIDPVLFPPGFIILRKLVWSQKLLSRKMPLIKTTMARRREFTDLDRAFNDFRKKKVFRYMSDESLWDYLKGITLPKPGGVFQLAFSPEWETRIYSTGIWNDLDLWRNLSRLKLPILVIRGAKTDTFLPPAENLLKKRLPDAQFVTVENSTHLVPLERPKEVGRIILQFLQEKL